MNTKYAVWTKNDFLTFTGFFAGVEDGNLLFTDFNTIKVEVNDGTTKVMPGACLGIPLTDVEEIQVYPVDGEDPAYPLFSIETE